MSWRGVAWRRVVWRGVAWGVVWCVVSVAARLLGAAPRQAAATDRYCGLLLEMIDEGLLAAGGRLTVVTDVVLRTTQVHIATVAKHEARFAESNVRIAYSV